jgi:Protein of unknown function (DUF3500)
MVSAGAGEIFLASLSPEQRAMAAFAFHDDCRQDWHFVPKQRCGIPYKQMSQAQRQLANAMINTGLSWQGFLKASIIMSLEPILHELEQGRGPVRDAELYYLSVFGDQRSSEPWGWRVEGHHLSINFTLVSNDFVASTPSFFGANPAEVQHGPRKGLRALPSEEDIAKTLLRSLDSEQRVQAIISHEAPSDILSGNLRRANLIEPVGLPGNRLSGQQTEILLSLLKEYVENMAPNIASVRMSELRSAGFDKVCFAWAGGVDHGQPHYYRIQGPTFLIEYDNIQNNANHIHSVWRDFSGDFGRDVLGQHHKDAHR